MISLNDSYKAGRKADLVITKYQAGLYTKHGTVAYQRPPLAYELVPGSRVFAANERHVFVVKDILPDGDGNNSSYRIILVRYPAKPMVPIQLPDYHEWVDIPPLVDLPITSDAFRSSRRQADNDLIEFGDDPSRLVARTSRLAGFSLEFAQRRPAGVLEELWRLHLRMNAAQPFNHSKDCMTSLDEWKFPAHELIGETTFVRFDPSGQRIAVKCVENMRGDVMAYQLANKQWMVTPKGSGDNPGLLPAYNISFLLCAMAVSARGKDANAVEDHLDRWTGGENDGLMWASAFDNEAVIRAVQTPGQRVHRLDMSQDNADMALEKLREHIAMYGPAIIIRDEATLGQKAARLCHIVDAVEQDRLTIREPITGEQHVISNHKEFWQNDVASTTATPIKVSRNWLEKKLRKLTHAAQAPNPFAGVTAVFIPAGAVPTQAPR
ncbi:hypothetical protein [Bordetella sp. LUAb4]|uniref:hypothetical protein n=1 Tax=Bordetella sp. LUAb4 TaxID=2843195 RepID=UPI001E5F678B|nr:hypothetical protein [Bordetella sp. LUAb4]